jgi:hypothetical protein
MTGDELLYEYAPAPLFHGRRWGSWTLDTERLVLVYDAHLHAVIRGDGPGVTEGVPQYTAFLGPYELDLERVADSAQGLTQCPRLDPSPTSESMQRCLRKW